MSTRQSVSVNSSNLTYTGLQHFGSDGPQSSEFDDRADHALIIMFQRLNDTYTQPIDVFASKGPVKGDMLTPLIVKAIILMENVGAKIHGVVTDGARTNRKFWANESINVSGKFGDSKCHFDHPMDENRKVFVFSDTSHLIKCIRNRLESKGFLKVHVPGG